MAAIAPFTYVSARSKKKVELADFMAMYGGEKKKGSGYMGSDEIKNKLTAIAAAHNALIKKGE